MANPRQPVAKAEVTGAAAKNPGRHRGRGKHKLPALGDPFDYMGGEERVAWALFARELPWLTAAHRAMVEVACQLRARMICGEPLGITALSAYQSILSKLGATPTDDSRIARAEDDPEPDEFFGPN